MTLCHNGPFKPWSNRSGIKTPKTKRTMHQNAQCNKTPDYKTSNVTKKSKFYMKIRHWCTIFFKKIRNFSVVVSQISGVSRFVIERFVALGVFFALCVLLYRAFCYWAFCFWPFCYWAFCYWAFCTHSVKVRSLNRTVCKA